MLGEKKEENAPWPKRYTCARRKRTLICVIQKHIWQKLLLIFVEILTLDLTFPSCGLAFFESRGAEVQTWVGTRAEMSRRLLYHVQPLYLQICFPAAWRGIKTGEAPLLHSSGLWTLNATLLVWLQNLVISETRNWYPLHIWSLVFYMRMNCAGSNTVPHSINVTFQTSPAFTVYKLSIDTSFQMSLFTLKETKKKEKNSDTVWD